MTRAYRADSTETLWCEGHLSASQAARALGVSVATIQLWCRQGTLPSRRVGPGRGRLRIDPADLRSFVVATKSQDSGAAP